MHNQTHNHNTQNNFTLDDDSVITFLKNSPEFLSKHQHLIFEQIQNNTKQSLSELIIKDNRKKIAKLELKINSLLDRAKTNEDLFNDMMKLVAKLIKANSLAQLQENLFYFAKNRGLEAAYFFMFDDVKHDENNTYIINRKTFEPLRLSHFLQKPYYLGKLNKSQADIIQDKTIKVGSVAIHLVDDMGFLIFISKDELYYQMGHGTLLLEKVSQLLPIIIQKYAIR